MGLYGKYNEKEVAFFEMEVKKFYGGKTIPKKYFDLPSYKNIESGRDVLRTTSNLTYYGENHRSRNGLTWFLNKTPENFSLPIFRKTPVIRE